MQYRVVWEIDEFEADSPREAAQKALAIQRREGSSAVVFDVFDETGEMTRIDLDEDPEEWEPTPEQPEAMIDTANIALNAIDSRKGDIPCCNCGAGGELGEHHKETCPDHTPF